MGNIKGPMGGAYIVNVRGSLGGAYIVSIIGRLVVSIISI